MFENWYLICINRMNYKLVYCYFCVSKNNWCFDLIINLLLNNKCVSVRNVIM